MAHLPLVRAIVDRLGILPSIEERCPRHSLNRVSDAQCVLALILNVPSRGETILTPFTKQPQTRLTTEMAFDHQARKSPTVAGETPGM